MTKKQWRALAMTVLLLASARTAAAETITEFPVSIAADTIVAGSDGALWFAGRNKNTIGRITTAGAVTEFAIPVPAFGVLTNLTAGPDGAVWFGFVRDGPAVSIGRITTGGEITQFPLPPPSPEGIHAPLTITAGPDGALWFAEINDAKIGRITTTREFTEFPLPPVRNDSVMKLGYVGITTGPDGALWLADPAESQVYQIGRVTTAGAFNRFPLLPEWPSSGLRDVHGIAAGPDGAVWFTEGSATKIGRITTAGLVSEFPVPPASHSPHPTTLPPRPYPPRPYEITPGPDGALWFTDTFVNKIGRVTTTGELSELLLPAPNSYPTGITAGPDGAVWFTERDGDGGKIGRIEQISEQVKEDPRNFHWERWILCLEVLTSLAIIIARRLH